MRITTVNMMFEEPFTSNTVMAEVDFGTMSYSVTPLNGTTFNFQNQHNPNSVTKAVAALIAEAATKCEQILEMAGKHGTGNAHIQFPSIEEDVIEWDVKWEDPKRPSDAGFQYGLFCTGKGFTFSVQTLPGTMNGLTKAKLLYKASNGIEIWSGDETCLSRVGAVVDIVCLGLDPSKTTIYKESFRSAGNMRANAEAIMAALDEWRAKGCPVRYARRPK